MCPEGSLKLLTSGTYRGLLGDPQGTNRKIDDLIKNLFFRSNNPCIAYVLQEERKFKSPKQRLPGDVYGT